MSLLMGDSSKNAVGSLKTITITPPTPRETTLGTPLILPTSEPGSAQINYTVQQSDLPTITPIPNSVKYSASVITAGKMTTAGTISYRVLKNGSSVASASTTSITLNTFYTETHWRWFDVVPGDVLEVKLWSSVTDSNYDYSALTIYPTQLVIPSPNAILKDVVFNNNGNYGLLSIGNTSNNGNISIYPTTSTIPTANLVPGTTYNIPVMVSHSSLGLFRINNGDQAGNTTGHGVHATIRPNFQRNTVPSMITYRELLR